MKILYISGGKKHEENLRDAIEDYTERLSRWLKVEWLFTEDPLNNLKPEDYVVALDVNGKNYSTEELSKLISGAEVNSVKRMIFVVGGAYGLKESLIKRANVIWSLSDLTFPHMIVRLVLSEAVYRSYSLLKGSKYHHE